MKEGARPKISVVIPVHNAAAYLDGCLEGVCGQTVADMEILLVENGSSDGSGRLCDGWAQRDGRIKVFHTPGRGVSAARNMGIGKASGEWISFVDADDGVKKDMLAVLLRTAAETGCDMAGCGYEVTGSYAFGADKEGGVLPGEKAVLMTGREFVECGILNSDTRCWGKIFRREALGDSRFPEDITIGEDMLFLLELALKGMSAAVTDYKGYVYYINPAGAMEGSFSPSYMDQLVCWKRAEEKLKAHGLPCLEKTASIRMISAILTAGKLALVPRGEAGRNESYVRQCREELMEAWRRRGAFGLLPFSYKAKALFFRALPRLYLLFYHIWKSRRP